MTPMYAIQTQELSKAYGPVLALDGLTLTVEPGTVFGFLGPNGAGKTTTMRLLTGLARPSGGQAWVAGQELGRDGRVAARIGYLPEEPAFYPWMTPAEFLDHVGRLFGLPGPGRRARSRELLELVGLSSVHKRRIGGFSRGMRQRLGLAQALVNQPDVLLLDEPVSALDPAGRKEVLELIGQLGRSCTVFMSTHILQDVERVCDTVAIINRGQVVACEPTPQLLRRLDTRNVVVTPEGELDGLPKLKGFEAVARPNGAFAVTYRKGQSSVEQVLAAVRAAGVTIADIVTEDPDLEDVFLALTYGDESQVSPTKD